MPRRSPVPWRRRASPWWALVAAAGLLAAGCGGEAGGGDATAGTGPATAAATTAPPGAATDPEAVPVVVYLVDRRTGTVRAAGRSVPQGAEDPARAALEALLAGPTAAEAHAGLETRIAAGTGLRGLAVADGVATVALTGPAAGGAERATEGPAALGQVVHTLTAVEGIDAVRATIDGAPLGGDGAARTRADVEATAPAVLVESPLPGAVRSCPLVVEGTANTFEATYRWRLTPAGGQPVEGYGTATSGTGTRGTFRQAIPCSDASGPAILRLWTDSAADGSARDIVEIPLAGASPD